MNKFLGAEKVLEEEEKLSVFGQTEASLKEKVVNPADKIL
jgi:hypothetical protein